MWNVYMIIILGAAAFGLTRITKTNNKLAKAILAAQLISIALTYVPRPAIIETGFFLFIGTIAASAIYGVTTKGLSAKTQNLILLISVPLLIRHIFVLMQWPYAGFIGYFMLIPILAFVYLLKTEHKERAEEIGFLSINAASALVGFLITLNWSI
jgi:uncharacterized membrane protein